VAARRAPFAVQEIANDEVSIEAAMDASLSGRY
jgi:hypothetical protein